MVADITKITISKNKLIHHLLKDDIQEGDLNRPEMTAKLLNTLESAMYLALKKGNYSAGSANGKVLMQLIGLDTQNLNHHHGFKHGKTSYTTTKAVKVVSISFKN